MGKGDLKTKKGKRIRGSYGKSRQRKPSGNPAKVVKDEAEVATKEAAE